MNTLAALRREWGISSRRWQSVSEFLTDVLGDKESLKALTGWGTGGFF